MGVQQQLFEKLGGSLVTQLRASIADTRTSGRTEASIHAVTGENFLEIWGARSLGSLEYGRKPSAAGNKPGKLYDIILQWVKTKGIIYQDGIIKSKYSIQERTAKTITHFIHQRGNRLFATGTDYYGKGKGERITKVLESLNLDTLLREVTALKVNEYSSDVIRELKQLQ